MEPEENRDCAPNMAEFPQVQKTAHEADTSEGGQHKADSDSEATGEQSKPKKKKEGSEKPPGFAPGLEPERIVGAIHSSGELMFLMNGETVMWLTWASPRKPMSSAPRLIISFYEEQLMWHFCPLEDDDKKDDRS